MDLTKKQERWINELTELWNFYDQRLKNFRINATTLRFFLLLTMTVASHRLIRGFLAQLNGGSNDNLDSKLRTLTETAINIQYILGEETDNRAKAYVLNGVASRINALDKIIGLLEQNNADAWAAINSIEGYKELRREKQLELSDLKARYWLLRIAVRKSVA